MILKHDYEFSGRVQKAPFSALTNFGEVYDPFTRFQEEKDSPLTFALRDPIVVYTLVLITQKLYFTYAGEGFMVIFEKTLTLPGAIGDATELRSTYMKAAARINEAIQCKLANDSVFTFYAKRS